MNQIGASHITSADFLIVSGTILLYVMLSNLPPNGAMCRIIALLSACSVVAVVMVLILSDNLGRNALGLSTVGMWICFGLWKWHQRAKSTPATFNPTETSG
jgi:hypothetical protein